MKIPSFCSFIKKKSKKANNYVATEDKLLKDIVKSLKPHYLANDENASELKLEICINDDVVFNSLGFKNNANVFKKRMEELLETELGISFQDIIICNNQTISSSWAKIGDSEIYWKVKSKCVKACVKAIKGFGSLLQDEYTLFPSNIYKIGRGETPQLDNGAIRINDIVINDSDEAVDREKNNFVSRNHAHIFYEESKGCLLFVDAGGRACVGKRTRVQRGENYIELHSDLRNPIPLQDNDIIELGKNVKIQFYYLND